jgi:hypothetical protein
MANLDDIIGKKEKSFDGEAVDVGGICEECFWPLDHGWHNKKLKKLKIVCEKGHERIIDWDANDGRQ